MKFISSPTIWKFGYDYVERKWKFVRWTKKKKKFESLIIQSEYYKKGYPYKNWKKKTVSLIRTAMSFIIPKLNCLNAWGRRNLHPRIIDFPSFLIDKHYKNILPKFQVNRSKTLEIIDKVSPLFGNNLAVALRTKTLNAYVQLVAHILHKKYFPSFEFFENLALSIFYTHKMVEFFDKNRVFHFKWP